MTPTDPPAAVDHNAQHPTSGSTPSTLGGDGLMVRYPRFDGTQACADLTPTDAAAYLPLPPAQANLAAARRRCSGCLFRAACQGYALGHDVQGIWGGLDDRQRRAQRAAAALPEPPSVTQELDYLVLSARSLPGPLELGHSA